MSSRHREKLAYFLTLVAFLIATPVRAQIAFAPAGNSTEAISQSSKVDASSLSPRTVTGDNVADLYKNPLVWLILLFILVSIGAWFYVKLAATTDPQCLAATDPWIQERIAQSQANAARLEAEQSSRSGSR